MPFIPVPQTAEVVFSHLLDGEEVNNVLNFFTDAPINQIALEQLAQEANFQWYTNVMPELSALLTLVETRVRDLSEADSLTAVEVNLTPIAGGIAGECTSNQVAACMTHRTGRIGRSRRGRTYFGGIPESRLTGNVLSSTLTSNLVTAFVGLRAALFTAGWQFVIVSRYSGGVARATGLTTIVTDSLFRDQRVDTLRGRLPD